MHLESPALSLTGAGLSVGEAAPVEPGDHVLDLRLGDGLSGGKAGRETSRNKGRRNNACGRGW